MEYISKKDGFKHEKLIVLPEDIQVKISEDPLTSSLYITDIGYFPRAKHHFRERLNGVNNYILLFCVDGCGHLDIHGTTISMTKNQLFIINKNVAHKYYAHSQNPWSIYWMHFNGYQASAFTELINDQQKPSHMNNEQHFELLRLFTSIFIQLELGYSRDHLIYISSLLHLFFSTIRIQSRSYNLGQETSSDYINDIIIYMQSHINQSLSVKELAQSLNISPSYLIHYFKEKTGYSPIDYFIQMKVQKACHLLDSKDYLIKDIALQVGYPDPYYFSRLFKKIMHMSPRAYRQIEKG